MYQKTRKGWEEAKERKYHLGARTHTALMLVVGAKPVAVLAQQWQAIGCPADVGELLERGGFIELAQLGSANADSHGEPEKVDHGSSHASANDVSRFLDASLFLEQTVMTAAGIRSYFFQLKLQKCGTIPDLRSMLPHYEKLMVKGGKPQAKVLIDEARRLLA
jgi:hypothetical protein